MTPSNTVVTSVNQIDISRFFFIYPSSFKPALKPIVRCHIYSWPLGFHLKTFPASHNPSPQHPRRSCQSDVRDDQIDRLDADERRDDAAEAVHEQIPAQQGRRPKRAIADAAQRERHE